MKTTNTINQSQAILEKKTAEIPQDLFFDVLRILTGNNIRFRIAGIKENENVVLIEFLLDPAIANHELALKNIQKLLSAYNYFTEGLFRNGFRVLDTNESMYK
jgi:hypothetical protein